VLALLAHYRLMFRTLNAGESRLAPRGIRVDWDGLYLVGIGVLIGGYGWWAASSAVELERNQRSLNLVRNVISRMGAQAFRWSYVALGVVFLIAGVYTVISGQPIGGSSTSWPSEVRSSFIKSCTASNFSPARCGCFADQLSKSIPADQLGKIKSDDPRFVTALSRCNQ
jgi:hypothetical protein